MYANQVKTEADNSRAATPELSVSDEDVHQRAYFIWKDTGREDMNANWFQALEELHRERGIVCVD